MKRKYRESAEFKRTQRETAGEALYRIVEEDEEEDEEPEDSDERE